MNAASPSTVAVLGGTGFVGRNVCAAFVEAGHDVVAIARTAAQPPPGCRLEHLDLSVAGPERIAALLRSIDARTVVNAAGAVWAVNRVQLTEQQVIDGNLTVVERMLAAFDLLDPKPRLVHLGSTYEYGPQPDDSVLTEETPERPAAHYGIVKLKATDLVREAGRTGRAETVTLRLTTSVGPWAPAASLMGRVASGLAKNPERLEIPALEDERDFVDARDVAAAAVAAAERPITRDLYNIASTAVVPVAHAVDLLIKTAGRDAKISWLPRVAGRSDAGVIGTQRIDITAAREHLGWQPRYTLAETLRALWDSARAQEEGWRG